MHNKGLHTELEYFSKEYDEEREMEPRPARVRETTLVLRIESPSRRQKERVVEFEDVPNREGDRVERNSPALSSSLSKKQEWSTLIVIFNQRLFADSTGCVTPFVHWIKDYPLPDGLKMPSHMGSSNRKGDPNNYLYLFEGAICMPKWAMPVACHMFTYTLKDSARIWWNGQKADDTFQILGLHEEHRIPVFVHGLKTRSLMEFLFNGTPNDQVFGKFKKKNSWDNNKGKKNISGFSPYRGVNHGLLSNLSKSPREILATKKVTKAFKQPPCLIEGRRSRDMSKYCHFHEDHRLDTNQCLELRH
ncbi:hypothetical protein Tco_1117393 [Tanacetum coccineum]